MYLRTLTLNNFRCYESMTIDQIDRLAVFVGENDAGKTVILDAIERLLGTSPMVASDFRQNGSEEPSPDCSIRGLFQLTENDTIPLEFRNDEVFTLERAYHREISGSITARTMVVCRSYSDGRFDNFESMPAPEQKELLEQYIESAGRNKDQRLEQVKELVSSGVLPLVDRAVTLQPAKANGLKDHLPKVERIAANEYQTPEQVVRRTFQAIAADLLTPLDADSNTRKEIEQLSIVREKVEARLNDEASRLLPILQQEHRNLRGVFVRPFIDFTKAVTSTPLALDCGEGERAVESFGEGTKRRLWMGLLNWERQSLDERPIRNSIRLYDEPDVNLHYEAQRQLFKNILGLSDDDRSEIQCIVCTHSLHLIDRAPVHTVNLIKIEDDGGRLLVRIIGLEDSDYTDFYEEVGQAIGLSNTAIFFERAFLLVEGDSEELAIPIIYRNIYGRSLRDDGIRLVNLLTCGAWKTVLRVLLKNRLDVVHLLLDTDCVHPDSSAKVTPESIQEIGCPANFEIENVTYIGTKEYEDSFSSQLIVDAASSMVEFETGISPIDIDGLRASGDKFSKDVTDYVRNHCKLHQRSSVKKTTLATAVARQCISRDDIPPKLLDALDAVRALARATSE